MLLHLRRTNEFSALDLSATWLELSISYGKTTQIGRIPRGNKVRRRAAPLRDQPATIAHLQHRQRRTMAGAEIAGYATEQPSVATDSSLTAENPDAENIRTWSPPDATLAAVPLRYSFNLWTPAGRLLASVNQVDDGVSELMQHMDEGIFEIDGIPRATTEVDGSHLTSYIVEWDGRLLMDGQTFSDYGVPQGADLTVYLVVTHHDSIVTRP